MKIYEFENLKEFFNKIKSIGFIERLFFWKNVVTLSHDAYAEFKSVDKQLQAVNEELQKASSKVDSLEQNKDHLKEVKANLEAEKKSLEQKKEELSSVITKLEKKLTEFDKLKEDKVELVSEKNVLKEKHEELSNNIKELEKQISASEKVEMKKQEEYEHKVTELHSLKKQLDDDRIRIQEEREQEIEDRFEKMKGIWKEHEDKVKEITKTICSRHNIKYVDDVPFKGNPDNTLRICGEHIIFDAKSPKTDDLSNFKKYIKDQAEAAKKYAKIKDVKKEIFLVVPTNTIKVINQTYYNLVDYCVHVVTIDALEPIILSLRKIEDYDFVEQLSPEGRAHICRIIGKFAHTTKRRIQVDNFFTNEFIDILNKCYDLPKDILDGSIEAEKSGKLNPPMEKRAKVISTDDLKKEHKRTKKNAEAQDIDTKAKLDVIESVPLYKEED
jgi:hypothetical protein